MKNAALLLCFSLVSLQPRELSAEAPLRDVTFATVDSHDLKLNLFLPDSVEPPPLVVFVHGGSWQVGSYKNCAVKWLVDEGFAVASIGYRLSDIATFPAQVHDCKAAVRWLRAHADDYGYDATRIGAVGSSAGGYLVLMMGVTSNNADYEGEVGDCPKESSAVQAVVDYFGASDFLQRSENQPGKTDHPKGSVRLMLGAAVKENPELARRASPAFHITGEAPPLLMLHGEDDRTVLLDQSQRMLAAYHDAGRDAELVVLPGAGHGGDAFYTPERKELVAEFLTRHLR
ncbi:alpha/beta hydrolase [Botrimarina colliarenosi]|nr:alpha/beta hydrolase [Botrimarina colliarenosi]